MKIVAFTDSHGSMKALKTVKEKAKENSADIIICAGDISIFGNQLKVLVDDLAKAKIPILMLHGNHESAEHLNEICKPHKNITFLHKKVVTLKDKTGKIHFLGWGGGGFSLVDREFEGFAKKAMKSIGKNERIVLVTHAPPYRTELDDIMGSPCGCKSFKNFILNEKPLLAISGHIHENNGKKQVVGKTLVINPGPYGAVLKV